MTTDFKFHDYDNKEKTEQKEEVVEDVGWKKPDNWIPVASVSMDLTEGCSLRCNYCFCDTEAEKKEGNILDVNIGKKAIDLLLNPEFSGPNTEVHLEWWGGEPFTQFDKIKELSTYALMRSADLKRKGIIKDVAFGATTNIVSLNEERIQHMLDYNLKPLLSIDGRGERNKNRPLKGSYKNSWELIESKLPMIKEMFATKGWKPAFRMTMSPNVIEGFAEDFIWFNEFGAAEVMVSENFDVHWSKEDYDAYEREIEMVEDYRISKFIEDGTVIASKVMDGTFKNKVETMFGTASPQTYACGAGRTYMGISIEGALYPCHRTNKHNTMETRWQDKDWALGHIDEGITNDKLYQTFHDMKNPVNNEESNLEKCKTCSINKYCHGYCAAVSMDTNDSWTIQTDRECDMSRMFYKQVEKTIAKLVKADKLLEWCKAFSIKLPFETINNGPDFSKGQFYTCTAYSNVAEDVKIDVIHNSESNLMDDDMGNLLFAKDIIEKMIYDKAKDKKFIPTVNCGVNTQGGAMSLPNNADKIDKESIKNVLFAVIKQSEGQDVSNQSG